MNARFGVAPFGRVEGRFGSRFGSRFGREMLDLDPGDFVTPAVDTKPKPFVTPAEFYKALSFVTPKEEKKPISFSTPAIDTKPETESIPISETDMSPMKTYIGPKAKGWREFPGVETPEGDYIPEGAFSRLADRKIRKEISDEGSKWTNMDEFVNSLPYDEKLGILGGSNQMQVKNLLNHPEFYKNYPDLEEMFVNSLALKDMHGSRGSFGDGQVSIDSDVIRSPEGKSTLLHELQHAIQEKEGWARGGSPSDYDGEREYWINEKNKVSDLLRNIPTHTNVSQDQINQLRERLEYTQGKLEQFENTDNTPLKKYQRLAGEVEARDVQDRMNLPMSERAKKMPYASQGIPVNRQIVRFGGGRAESVDLIPEEEYGKPYDLGAGFGSTVLRDMLNRGQGKFSKEQMLSELGKMSQDEREMLNWQGWNPDRPMTSSELSDKAMKDKMMLNEVVKGDENSNWTREEQKRFHQLQAMNDMGNLDPRLEDEYLELVNKAGLQGRTKHNRPDLVLPGGENYREVLLTLPSKESFEQWAEKVGFDLSDESQLDEAKFVYNDRIARERGGKTGNFTSSHWDEPNVLAHYRMNDRKFGQKPFGFIEEIQSDWHQKGREVGYKISEKEKKRMEAEINSLRREYNELGGQSKIDELVEQFEKRTGKKAFIDGVQPDEIASEWDNSPEGSEWNRMVELEEKSYELMGKLKNENEGLVPDAPFKKTWHELAAKHALAKAAKEGKEGIGFTTGEQQAERYDLSKQISKLDYIKNDDGTYHLEADLPNGGQHIFGDNIPAEKLSDYVGKELSKKIIEGEGAISKSSGMKFLKGVDLKVGGEGMKGFYDQMIPAFLNKYTKKWGGRVGEGITTTATKNIGGKEVGYQAEKVHALEITPAMKEYFKSLSKKGTNDVPDFYKFNIGSKEIQVIKNPSRGDRSFLMEKFREKFPNARSGEPKIRFAYDDNGNRYEWMSDTTHDEVQNHFKNRFGLDLNQNLKT